jgi:hypothetical protein
MSFSPGNALSPLLLQSDGSLTFQEILADPPLDPASIVAIVPLLGSVGVGAYFGTRPDTSQHDSDQESRT